MNNHLIAPDGYYYSNHDKTLIVKELYLSDLDTPKNYTFISQSEYEEILKQRELDRLIAEEEYRKQQEINKSM